MKRLYVITGKGGVGKTVLSMSLTKHLESLGKKVIYTSFDQPLNKSLVTELNIPALEFEIRDSAKKYMGNKLGSEIIAGWIMKTPFFSSLFNMLPGLGQMILLGNIISLLENDPNLVIVLDSPSSGHAISMLEASQNFKNMFRTGLIVSDIDRMHSFLYNEDLFKSIIVSLPTSMALQESQELKEAINELQFKNISIAVNDILEKNYEINQVPESHLPNFLITKLKIEREALGLNQGTINDYFPHISEKSSAEVIRKLIPLMEALI